MRIALSILLPYFGFLAWLSFMILRSPSLTNGNWAIPLLTLAVTVMGAVLGLFGIGGMWFFWKIRDMAEAARLQVESVRRNAEGAMATIAAVRSKAEGQLQLLQLSTTAAYPSGLYLHEELERTLAGLGRFSEVCGQECGAKLDKLVRELIAAFGENAELVGHVHQLFSRDVEAVRSALLFFEGRRTAYTIRLLEDRLEVEKGLEEIDPEIVEATARALQRMT